MRSFFFGFAPRSAQFFKRAAKLGNRLRERTAAADLSGRSGLVVTRLPAAREDPGSRRAVGKSLCFHENHCDTQLWARAAH